MQQVQDLPLQHMHCSSVSLLAQESEIEPKPPTPAYTRPTGRHQLTQTSSGNLCFGGTEVAQSRAEGPTSGLSTQPQTPEAFRLQPKPTRRQAVDVNTLRIMQMQRSVSELPASNADALATAVSDAVSLELNEMLSQPRLHQVHQAPAAAGIDIDRKSGVEDIRMRADDEDEEGNAEPSGSNVEQGDGLYAAAKLVPGELKAAWSKHVQQPIERKSLRQQILGRSSEDKMSSPSRLLKCLQSRTDSDVEAQMEAMRFKH